MLDLKLRGDWFDLLCGEFEKPYFTNLLEFVEKEYKTQTIFPPQEKIFNALNSVKFKDVKVVIMGQDPYHEMGQAEGLSFSVPTGIKCPPSLVNIKKEIKAELGGTFSENGSLVNWTKQGVLLLNSVLTVREHYANSHKNKGWEKFTQKVIEILNQSDKPICFVAWGNNAKTILKDIDTTKHLLLVSAHPSPLSAFNGFFGNNHFKMINEFLVKTGQNPINWEF
ncbi:MAG: uracil-DNA glycosylase [Clostridia bacterium]|nr:uracil-DNA glycosylase [Clostridia bacterium]